MFAVLQYADNQINTPNAFDIRLLHFVLKKQIAERFFF